MAEVYPSYSLALYDHLARHGSIRCHAISACTVGIPISITRAVRRPLFQIWQVELRALKVRQGYGVSRLRVETHSWSEKKILRSAEGFPDCVGWLINAYSPERFARSVCERLGIGARVDPASLSQLVPWFDPAKLGNRFVVQIRKYSRRKVAIVLTSSVPSDEGKPEELRWFCLTPIGAIRGIYRRIVSWGQLVEDIAGYRICDREVAVKAVDGVEPDASFLYIALKDAEGRSGLVVL